MRWKYPDLAARLDDDGKRACSKQVDPLIAQDGLIDHEAFAAAFVSRTRIFNNADAVYSGGTRRLAMMPIENPYENQSIRIKNTYIAGVNRRF